MDEVKVSFFSKIGTIISKFFDDSKRILIVSKKPTKEEYKKMALIVALGILIIGIIGYIIYLIFGLTGLGK